MEKVFIYALCEPETGEVRYVGKATNPKNRFSHHVKLRDNPNKRKRDWIEGLLKVGNVPTLSILEEVEEDRWQEREKYHIARYKELGFDLVNKSPGGGGNKKHLRRAVVRFTKKGRKVDEFFSISRATEETGIHMAETLSGEKKSAGGYLWMYKDKWEKMTKEEFENWLSWCNTDNTKTTQFSKGKVPPSQKPISQYHPVSGLLLKTWRSPHEAVQELGGCKGAIATALRQSGFTLGFYWSYKRVKKIALHSGMPSRKKIPVKQICPETGVTIMEWTTVREAAENLKISEAAIRQSMYSKKYRNRAGGYFWNK